MTNPTDPIRIVIAGEQSIFREGLRRLLETEAGFLIIGETARGSSAARLAVDFRADVLLLELVTAGPPLADTIRELAALNRSIRAIVLTDRVERPDIAFALEAGARGVVLKDSAPDVLFACIRHVMTGDLWLGDARAADAKPGLRKLESALRRAKLFGLTAREIEIIGAVVAGCSNREIAERVHVSENTVKSHLINIFNKSGASNRVELALFAAHHRLLDGF